MTTTEQPTLVKDEVHLNIPHGVHLNIPHATYINDPAPSPSLNATTANILLTKSALHAAYQHPRLHSQVASSSAPEPARAAPTPAMITGSAIHDIVHSDGSGIAVWDGDSWRKAEARAFRDSAIDKGDVPMLAADMKDVQAAAASATTVFDALFPNGFNSEVTGILKTDTGGWRRCRWDAISYEPANGEIIICDLKTSSASAHPTEAALRAARSATLLQAAAYTDLARRLHPEAETVTFCVVAVEQGPPFCASPPMAIPLTVIRHFTQRWRQAEDLWDAAIRNSYWPGYGTSPITMPLPAWATKDYEYEQI